MAQELGWWGSDASETIRMSEVNKDHVIADQNFSGQTFSHVEEGAAYMNCVFRDTRWINVSLQHVRFINCHFDNMYCAAMRVIDTHWNACDMNHLQWQEVDINQSHITDSTVNDWHADESRLMHVGITNTAISNWFIKDCRLRNFTWMGCTVQSYSQVLCRASDVSWIDSKIANAKLERCSLERMIAAQVESSGLSFFACTGRHVRTTQGKVSNAIYKDNQIDGASWSHSELNDCQFINCKMPLVGFDNASLNQVSFERVEMPRVLFDHAILKSSLFKEVQAAHASLRNAQLSSVAFSQTNLSGVDARGARVDRLTLNDVDCRRANLIGQDPKVWCEAELHGAHFEESKELDDLEWWAATRPGHRVVIS